MKLTEVFILSLSVLSETNIGFVYIIEKQITIPYFNIVLLLCA